jgi:hypothetical protein
LQGVILTIGNSDQVRGADFSGANVWRAALSLDPRAVLSLDHSNSPLPVRAEDLDFSPSVPFPIIHAANRSASSTYDVILSGTLSGIPAYLLLEDYPHLSLRDDITRGLYVLHPDAFTKLPGNRGAEDITNRRADGWRAAAKSGLSKDAMQDQKWQIFQSIACRDNRLPNAGRERTPDKEPVDLLFDLLFKDRDIWSGRGGWIPGPQEEPYAGAPFVAEALVRNEQIQSLGRHASELSRILNDPESCPGAARIAPDIRAALNAIRRGTN